MTKDVKVHYWVTSNALGAAKHENAYTDMHESGVLYIFSRDGGSLMAIYRSWQKVEFV